MNKLINKKSLVMIISVVLLSPILVNCYYSLKSPFGFISSENINGWIGFAGSILGGSLTLVGVLLTILYQRESKKEELCVQFKPVINISSSDDKSIEFYLPTKTLNFGVKLINGGRGEAKIIKSTVNHCLISSEYPTFEDFENSAIHAEVVLNNNEGWSVPISQHVELLFDVSSEDSKNTVSACSILLSVSVEYNGLYNSVYTSDFVFLIAREKYGTTYQFNLLSFTINDLKNNSRSLG